MVFPFRKLFLSMSLLNCLILYIPSELWVKIILLLYTAILVGKPYSCWSFYRISVNKWTLFIYKTFKLLVILCLIKLNAEVNIFSIFYWNKDASMKIKNQRTLKGTYWKMLAPVHAKTQDPMRTQDLITENPGPTTLWGPRNQYP